MADPSTDQDQTTSVEPSEPRRGGGTWLLWLLVLPVLYVLSIGPAARYFFLGSFTPSPRALHAFYSPLNFLYRKSSTVRHSMDWYINLWVAPRPAAPTSPPPASTSGTSTN
jgi:hypothetical protein